MYEKTARRVDTKVLGDANQLIYQPRLGAQGIYRFPLTLHARVGTGFPKKESRAAESNTPPLR